MHSKHGTTIICADHTKWSHQIQRYDNSLSKLGLIPTFNSLVKKKEKKNIHLWHIWVWYYGYEILVRFLKVLSTSYLMHYDLLSIWGWEGACPQNNSNWQLGVLKKQNKVGSDILFYNLFDWCWCYFVSFDKESIFKSCMRTVRQSGFESALTPVYFNDKVKVKWLSSVL